jgi:hypothetical protein
MAEKHYTREDIAKAIEICSQDCECLKCPLGSSRSRDCIHWETCGPHYTHPASMSATEKAELVAVACEKLCDPLYLDILEVKETCNDANT